MRWAMKFEYCNRLFRKIEMSVHLQQQHVVPIYYFITFITITLFLQRLKET